MRGPGEQPEKEDDRPGHGQKNPKARVIYDEQKGYGRQDSPDLRVRPNAAPGFCQVEDAVVPSPAQEGNRARGGNQDVSQGEEAERPEGREGDRDQGAGKEVRLKAVRSLP